jgi:lysine 2,3-aminomutase
MSGPSQDTCWNVETFRREASELLLPLAVCRDLRSARKRLFFAATHHQFDTYLADAEEDTDSIAVVRDCARAMRGLVKERSDARAAFSVAQALWDIARGVPRTDLGPGFFAEMTHLVQGIEGRAPYRTPGDSRLRDGLSGRAAAQARSEELDLIARRVAGCMERYADGLSDESRERRAGRRRQVLAALGGTESDWTDWRWQAGNVVTSPEKLATVVHLSPGEEVGARRACSGGLPFGLTPYYAALMDTEPGGGRDRALRAQVLPPEDYVSEMIERRGDPECSLDFMREGDTSPVDLVTRRYPGIAILKPFNTCPQICVYCQRNWEIDQAMAPAALAPAEKIEAACRWLEDHPGIREVLVTGGDPLAMPDEDVERILGRVAAIPHVDLIRIGSRVPVTMPMRITVRLAGFLGSLRQPGRREVCLSTHVQHPYEVTPDLVAAIGRLRAAGVAVFNQLVYTFHVSRRFEAARLRQLLRLAGIAPYYTFAPKGKQETRSYRVPLARIVQEQNEEARLLPGTRRTDEAIYNVPGLGKNYLRAAQHRDLISVLPDGSRVYEFHPWEKNIVRRESYVATDVPILEYLTRLAGIGEDPEEYASIWYYF